MPPKKSKLQEECENKHVEEVCEDLNCDEKECNMRHPNPCNFGPRCKFNRRKECMYMHDISVPSDVKVEALNKKFDKLEKHVNKLEADLESKDEEIQNLKDKYQKLLIRLLNWRRMHKLMDWS